MAKKIAYARSRKRVRGKEKDAVIPEGGVKLFAQLHTEESHLVHALRVPAKERILRIAEGEEEERTRGREWTRWRRAQGLAMYGATAR